MIDDVVSFVKIAEVLKERGAYKVFVMATHGLLSSDAPRLIEESCIDEVRKLDFFVCFKQLRLNALRTWVVAWKALLLVPNYP